MNGPEHYHLAEDLAHDARLILEQATANTLEGANSGASALAAVAQVHATLALAAATAAPHNTFDGGDGSTTTYVEPDTWNTVLR